jgi:hypothetical protein
MDGCVARDTEAMKRVSTIVAALLLALPAAADASVRPQVARGGLPFGSSDIVLLAGGVVVLVVAGVLARRLTALLNPYRGTASAVQTDGRRSQARPGYPQPASGR